MRGRPRVLAISASPPPAWKARHLTVWREKFLPFLQNQFVLIIEICQNAPRVTHLRNCLRYFCTLPGDETDLGLHSYGSNRDAGFNLQKISEFSIWTVPKL